jgi:hypothetical protein
LKYIITPICAIAMLLLAACGGQAAVPTPAPTVAPTATAAPTATPRPTNTPLPPTATPAPPTATPGAAEGKAAEAISASFEQVRDAASYRLELDVASTGAALGSAEPGSASQLIGATGEVAGDDSHITLTGLFGQLLGADPAKGLELITVDGTSYVRGPVPLLGAAEARWYELPADGSSPASSVQPGAVVGGVLSDDMDLSGFVAGDEEQLDGQTCQVYIGDKDATVAAFEQIGDQGLPGPQNFSEVRRAEMRFWVCEDGYLHKLTLDTEGLQAGQSEPIGYTMNVRLFDFGADVDIAAPAGAEPVTPPSFGLPTPTP